MNKLTVSNEIEYLKNQGIGFLTSESCGIGIRLLFDLSIRGKEIVESFFSIKAMNQNWNPYVGEDVAIASIRLPRAVLRPLAIFCLLMNGAEAVFDVQDSNERMLTKHLVAVWNDPGFASVYELDEYKKLYEDYNRIYNGKFRIWEDHSTGAMGTNTHVFSGRTA